MNKQKLFEETKAYLVNKYALCPIEIEPKARLKHDLDLDSLDRVTLFYELEKKYNIKISSAEEAKLKTVGDVVDFLSLKLQQD